MAITRPKANDGGYVRDHFFGRDPRTKARGGEHERPGYLEPQTGRPRLPQVYAAYRAAVDHKGQPTVILAKTIKATRWAKHFEKGRQCHPPDEKTDPGRP